MFTYRSYLLQSRMGPLGLRVFSSAKQVLNKLSVILYQSGEIIGLPKNLVSKKYRCRIGQMATYFFILSFQPNG